MRPPLLKSFLFPGWVCLAKMDRVVRPGTRYRGPQEPCFRRNVDPARRNAMPMLLFFMSMILLGGALMVAQKDELTKR